MMTAESARTRRRLIEEAGWSTTSFLSVLAGTLVAFGAVALVAAGAGAAGSALGLDVDGISTDEWRRAGIVSAVVGGLVVFASFWFGGYTAGRMSRRAGARHGLLVFLFSVLLLGVIGLVGWAVSDDSNVDVEGEIAAEGVPTDADTWGDIGLGAAIGAAVAMLLGSIGGGIRGDRWHGRLATAVVEHREEIRAQGSADLDRTETVEATSQLSVEEEREHTRS